MTSDEHPLDEILDGIMERANLANCIQCGRCTATCPAALPAPLRARSVVRAVQDGDMGVVLDRDDIWHCTTCFSCQERCPKGVLVTQAILWLRAEAVRSGKYPAPHIAALEELARSGNTFPLEPEVRVIRGQLSLPLDPPDCAHDEGEMDAFGRLLEVLGFSDLAPTRVLYDAEAECPYAPEDGDGQ